MTRRSPLLLAVLSLACATSPAATPSRPEAAAPAAQTQPPPAAAVVAAASLTPIGTFDFAATLPDGSQATGIFTITGSPGSYSGTISREDGSATPLTNISVDGQTLMFTTVIPDGTVGMTLTFTGNDFVGRWAVEGADGPVTGKRR